VFQVHGVDAHGEGVVTKCLHRHAMLTFLSNFAIGVIGLKACAGSDF
jgi:hypothetical protein